MNTQHLLGQPSSWVVRFSPLILKGEVLDLACGSGRHARHLADLGHAVLAVDRDPAMLEYARGEGISLLELDLEADDAEKSLLWPLKDGRFKGIVVTNYLHRPLLSALVRSLAPNGILIYETFALGNEHFGKPSNPKFLLQPGELLGLARDAAADSLHIVAFEQGYIEHPKPAMVQRICLFRPGDGEGASRILSI